MGFVGLYRGRKVADEMIGEDNVVLRAICDKNPQKLKDVKKYYENDRGIKNLLAFDNFDDLLASDVDAIFIATDADNHVPLAIKAMEAGKHVISEIPAVNSVEEAKALKACVKAHPKLKYSVAENCIYWAFIEAWKKMYEEGKFGEIVFAEGEYLHSTNEGKFEPMSDDNWRKFFPATKYITHELGPFLYIMDDKCVSVSCMTPDVRYNPYRKGYENSASIFKTQKGAVIKIFTGFGAYVGFDHNFSLYGTKGMIETDRTKPLLEAHSFARFSDIPGSIDTKIEIPVTLKFPGEKDGGHGGADRKMMRAFIKCIIDDTKPPIDVDMGIRMSLPGVFAHESAKNGGINIQISDID